MKPLHFRLISLIFLLIGANIEALQSEQNDRVNTVLEFPGNELDFFKVRERVNKPSPTSETLKCNFIPLYNLLQSK